MNQCEKDGCYSHPRELVIGICALCLNERLSILATKQSTVHRLHHRTRNKFTVTSKRVPMAVAKFFALASLLNLLEIRKQKIDRDCHSSSTSPEDSFISIKFEDNGVSSWAKGSKISKMPFDKPWDEDGGKAKKIKNVVEDTKPDATPRWRRRIGRILQLIRLNKFKKGNMCHVGTKPRRSKSSKKNWD